MKKLKLLAVTSLLLLSLTGCTEETVTTDEKGNTKKEFSITETASVNDTKIKINSVKKVTKDCLIEYDGKCQSYTEPENDYFLVIDLTIENTGDEELSISSMVSFDLKNTSGEKGEYTFLTESVSSQLDGSVMSGDLLKGQIAYDVKDDEKFNFYYSDSLLDDQIKFVINKTDIIE